jgi:hypothetical protein
MHVFPNPNDGDFAIKFFLKESAETKVSLYSIDGRKIEEFNLKNLSVGENTYQPKIEKSKLKGTYVLTIETLYQKATQKIIINQ